MHSKGRGLVRMYVSFGTVGGPIPAPAVGVVGGTIWRIGNFLRGDGRWAHQRPPAPWRAKAPREDGVSIAAIAIAMETNVSISGNGRSCCNTCRWPRRARPAAPAQILVGAQCEVENSVKTSPDRSQKAGFPPSGKCAAPPAEHFPHPHRPPFLLLRCTAWRTATAEVGRGLSIESAPPSTCRRAAVRWQLYWALAFWFLVLLSRHMCGK